MGVILIWQLGGNRDPTPDPPGRSSIPWKPPRWAWGGRWRDFDGAVPQALAGVWQRCPGGVDSGKPKAGKSRDIGILREFLTNARDHAK
jgi:hypothetical protein